jgi:hypothetical protein
MRKFTYKFWQYKFCELMADAFKVKPDELNNLHNIRSDLFQNDPALQKEWPYNEADTKFHKEFYGYLNSNQGQLLYKEFDRFIDKEVSQLFDESFVYQKFPSFRKCLPNSKAVGKWHCDSDKDHGHPEGEINFQIAITDIYGTNATWIESVPGFKDFHPIELKQGEYAVFNGNKCIHGNKINKTGVTRLSFDFRVIPISKYNPDSGLISATSTKKFIVGEYYKLYKKN